MSVNTVCTASKTLPFVNIIPPTKIPSIREEITSLVISARIIATRGGTIDNIPKSKQITLSSNKKLKTL